MSVIVTSFGLIVLAVMLSDSSQAASMRVPVITVCEALHALHTYNGQSVIVVGRIGSTDEGSWLSENCERKFVTDGFTWPSIISTTYSRSEVKPPPKLPKHFRSNKKLLTDKLKQIQKTTQLRAEAPVDAWIAMYGRLEARLPFEVAKTRDGSLIGNGFGHLNAAPAQLITDDAAYFKLAAK